MIDGIIKGDGTSRFLAGSLPATYEEFRQLAAEKKLPIDLLLNTDGWSQLPTFLNKGNLFSDPTAEKYGAGVVTPDAAFSFLGQYALHWWKRKSLGHYEVTYSIPSGTGDDTNGITLDINSTMAYSKSLMINPETENVILAPPVYYATYRDITNVLDQVRGSFAMTYYSYGGQPELVPTKAIPTEATWMPSFNKLYAYAATPYYQKTYVNDEVSVTFNVPTDSGADGDIYYLYPGASRFLAYSSKLTLNADGNVILDNPTVVNVSSSNIGTVIYALRGCFFNFLEGTMDEYPPIKVAPTNAQIQVSSTNYNILVYPAENYYSTSTKPAEWKYVQSKDRDAYPDSGEQDNYEYMYLGIPFDNAVTSRTVVGSYVGTGTYGVNSPNTYKLNGSPDLIVILGLLNSGTIGIGLLLSQLSESRPDVYVNGHLVIGGGSPGTLYYKIVSGTLYFYSARDVQNQLNVSGYIYKVWEIYL